MISNLRKTITHISFLTFHFIFSYNGYPILCIPLIRTSIIINLSIFSNFYKILSSISLVTLLTPSFSHTIQSMKPTTNISAPQEHTTSIKFTWLSFLVWCKLCRESMPASLRTIDVTAIIRWNLDDYSRKYCLTWFSVSSWARIVCCSKCSTESFCCSYLFLICNECSETGNSVV